MARTLLIVHHTPSPPMRELLESVLAGAGDPEISGVAVRSVPALGATVPDVLAADGFLFGTPANFGYMSGALKHFFDSVYYPCLGAVTGKPYAAWVHGNDDTIGAGRAIEKIASGWGLEKVFGTVHIVESGKPARERCYELGGTVAAGLSD
ncbi:flavodoxin family protein [Rhodococcus fascians]|nr:flavodoxin family protein [Rhodococcus fascians]MBY3996015.1 flavodoxin family protein [Rhodococcus fascians]MBY4001673.1 flavodoxin family protein [Rhodococcus fascians]MBY4006177.1 flavodoxin family protein [Rhodococcus fascians]MBY4017248.1 flavodoxin family protein [Rhodococcus fascians]